MVQKFGVMASTTFSFSGWDGRHPAACRAAVSIAHSAVISLYEACMLHILSLESHLLVHCVKSAMSLPVTGHRDNCVVMPPHDVHFPVTGAVIRISPKLHELFVRRQNSEVLPVRFSRTVPVARTLRSDNFFNVS
ncbi:conserved hypothetical protein [Trichinella spiralis]|uniref:hypothetical protein n=1 Tax=Trichinella spiralis TaxID=6334 RepID=UPI0001EFEE94|nr:conserved hypothetical protein [Trichinella spiralis]